MQFERESRFGYLKMRELVNEFCTRYLRMLQNRLMKHPLGPPSNAKQLLLEAGFEIRVHYIILLIKSHNILCIILYVLYLMDCN